MLWWDVAFAEGDVAAGGCGVEFPSVCLHCGVQVLFVLEGVCDGFDCVFFAVEECVFEVFGVVFAVDLIARVFLVAVSA